MAEPSEDSVDHDDGQQVDGEHSAQSRARSSLHVEREQDDAERGGGTASPAGKPSVPTRRAGREQLGRRRERDRGRRHGGGTKPQAWTAADGDSDQHDDEQDECDRARGQGEQDEHGSRPVPSRLQREQAEQGEQDAERESRLRLPGSLRARGARRNVRPARGSAPLPLEQAGERAGGEPNSEHREQPQAEDCSERVVEDAVVDVRVAPRVPEVVPEREAVVEEEPQLVLVRREVAAPRTEPDQQRRGDSRESGAERRPRARPAARGQADSRSSTTNETSPMAASVRFAS